MYELDKEIDIFLNSKEESAQKDRDYFYISEVGKSKKEIFNNWKKKNPKTEARLRRIFENGDYVHMRYMKMFAEMGILVAAEINAVNNELIHGRLDAIITDKTQNYIVDIKSCSQWTFTKLTAPQKDHYTQLLFYMYYMNIPRGFVLYENKDSQMIKCFYVEMSEQNKIAVEKTIEELKQLKEMIKNNIEPNEEPLCINDLVYEVKGGKNDI